MRKLSAVVVVIALAIVGFLVMRSVRHDSTPRPALESASSPGLEKKSNVVELASSETPADAPRAVIAPAATATATASAASATPIMATLRIHVTDKSSGRPLPHVVVMVGSKTPPPKTGEK